VLPRGGTAPDIGGSMRAAVELAVQEINATGGVRGRPVTVISRDEGDDPTSTLLVVQDLLQLGVDAIVGPTSSLNVLGTLGTTVDAGVLTCSPTASAMSLDDFPDQGLFVRTVPSDSLQAEALAGLVDDSGSSAAVVVYLDDAYGRPLATSVQEALTQRGTEVTGFFGFSTTTASIENTVSRVTALRPEMIVVIADSVSGPTVITAIDGAASPKRPSYVVNDAVRRPDSSITPFDRALSRRVMGVSPLAFTRSTEFSDALRTIDPDTTGVYAENAYDCVNLIALGAQASGSSRSSSIGAALPAISNGGSSCASFSECSSVLANDRNPDYDGPGGVLTIGDDGDVETATFERFGFDETGRDVGLGVVTIGAG
jgi:branched-chain amino acid transport system substrate-binding protein